MQGEVRYGRNPDFIFRKIIDEVILVPIHKDVADLDSLYTLNGVGAFIWQRLDSPATQAELQTALLGAYDADPDVLQSDLESFLDEMVDYGALRKVC
jgi:hypothetical protein